MCMCMYVGIQSTYAHNIRMRSSKTCIRTHHTGNYPPVPRFYTLSVRAIISHRNPLEPGWNRHPRGSPCTPGGSPASLGTSLGATVKYKLPHLTCQHSRTGTGTWGPGGRARTDVVPTHSNSATSPADTAVWSGAGCTLSQKDQFKSYPMSHR